MGLFSLFSKPRREDSLDRKISAMGNNISESFKKVKDDIQSIGKWLNRFEQSDEKHDEEIKSLKSELRYLRSLLTENQEVEEKKQKVKEPEIIEDVVEDFEQDSSINPLEHFTDTQKAIFSRLGVIQKEGSQSWIPLKQIAQEIYPDKQYDDVRSTISEYMGLLSDAGLVKRVRKGKQTFVSISEKGSKFFVDNRKKVTPKVK